MTREEIEPYKGYFVTLISEYSFGAYQRTGHIISLDKVSFIMDVIEDIVLGGDPYPLGPGRWNFEYEYVTEISRAKTPEELYSEFIK